MQYRLKAYNIHELGQRENQEDALYPKYGESSNDCRLFVLCDGMGGHEKGEVASNTVCETLSSYILERWNPNEPLTDELFKEALNATYDALDAKDDGAFKKMGTTMTFVCLHSEGATVAHIGDSRVYQIRPANGNEPAKIMFVTRDHSLVNDLIKVGEITEAEAKHHPQKNVITRAMQPCLPSRPKADIKHIDDIQKGDYFYMCSDGMLEQTEDEQLLFIIADSDKSNEEKVEKLKYVTEDNKDNHTAHLIEITEVIGAPLKAIIEEPTVIPTATPEKEDYTPETGPTSKITFIKEALSERKQQGNKKLILLLSLVIVILAAALYFSRGKKSNSTDSDKTKTEQGVNSKKDSKEKDSAKSSPSKSQAKPKQEETKEEVNAPEEKPAEEAKAEENKPGFILSFNTSEKKDNTTTDPKKEESK